MLAVDFVARLLATGALLFVGIFTSWAYGAWLTCTWAPFWRFIVVTVVGGINGTVCYHMIEAIWFG